MLTTRPPWLLLQESPVSVGAAILFLSPYGTLENNHRRFFDWGGKRMTAGHLWVRKRTGYEKVSLFKRAGNFCVVENCDVIKTRRKVMAINTKWGLGNLIMRIWHMRILFWLVLLLWRCFGFSPRTWALLSFFLRRRRRWGRVWQGNPALLQDKIN